MDNVQIGCAKFKRFCKEIAVDIEASDYIVAVYCKKGYDPEKSGMCIANISKRVYDDLITGIIDDHICRVIGP